MKENKMNPNTGVKNKGSIKTNDIILKRYRSQLKWPRRWENLSI